MHMQIQVQLKQKKGGYRPQSGTLGRDSCTEYRNIVLCTLCFAGENSPKHRKLDVLKITSYSVKLRECASVAARYVSRGCDLLHQARLEISRPRLGELALNCK